MYITAELVWNTNSVELEHRSGFVFRELEQRA